MMQAKRLLGVVVGSTDPHLHQKSFDEGEEAARLIEEYGEMPFYISSILLIKSSKGKFETCIIEVSTKGPWMLHRDGDKSSIDKVVKYTLMMY